MAQIWHKSVEDRAREITRRANDMHVLLLLTSGVTVSGLLFMYSWMEWPRAFFHAEMHATFQPEEYATIARSVRNYMAVRFGVMLASAFLPSWHWMQYENRRILKDYDKNKNYSKAGEELWMQENRQVFSRSSHLFAINIGGPILLQFIIKRK